MKTIEYDVLARLELIEAMDWYGDISPALLLRFQRAVLEAEQEILSGFIFHRKTTADLRVKQLARPFEVYALYYRNLTDSVRIVAVFHSSRNPSKLQGR